MQLLKRLALLTAVVAVLTTLQLTWPPGLRARLVGPDFLLVMMAVVALLNGPLTGAVTGFAGAVLLAAFSADPPIGLLLTRTTLGWLIGRLRAAVSGENLLSHWFVVATATIAHEGLYRGLQFLLAPSQQPHNLSLGHIANPSLLLYHFLLTPLLYAFAHRWSVSLDEIKGEASS